MDCGNDGSGTAGRSVLRKDADQIKINGSGSKHLVIYIYCIFFAPKNIVVVACCELRVLK